MVNEPALAPLYETALVLVRPDTHAVMELVGTVCLDQPTETERLFPGHP